MIKKLSLFFSAIAIGILSIFGGISTKNAAEPQYFLENTQVKKAIVKEENYNLNFYLDNNINFAIFIENIDFAIDEIIEYEPGDFELYYYDNQNNLINSNLGFLVDTYTASNQTISFFISEINNNNITIEGQFHLEIDLGGNNQDLFFVIRNNLSNVWLGNVYNENAEVVETINIKGFKINGALPYDNQYIQTINQELEHFIGTQTTLSPVAEETIPPLEQINTLVNDIVNWFTNIFNGLGNVFYDPTANKLTAWGTVIFIGVAIMLISMALKWVISLIRGV